MEMQIREMTTAPNWKAWANKIGTRPVFMFKAALSFIQDKCLDEEFEQYMQNLLRRDKEHLN